MSDLHESLAQGHVDGLTWALTLNARGTISEIVPLLSDLHGQLVGEDWLLTPDVAAPGKSAVADLSGLKDRQTADPP